MNGISMAALIIGAAGAFLAWRAARRLTRTYTKREIRSTFAMKADRAVPGLRMQRIYGQIARELRNNAAGTEAGVRIAARQFAVGLFLLVAAALLRGLAIG